METIAPILFQLFSLAAIILPVTAGGLALYFLWRIMKALEGMHKSLEMLTGEQKKGDESQSVHHLN
ncbi:hypothetical protein [Lihuaxuella thermophila]|uniref:Oxaloacetate decarboxylase, gamma chain n=1 Tax=Lihuaxuella thermophila TaxID=1173111 RepID=A0A1H8E6Y6_9BACL|nr:hypothetical protein [Lihuaxuella thermophila]SEN15331.1 hypothetical protein SAMN05444955_106168 [Lihuaxuella thermophila]